MRRTVADTRGFSLLEVLVSTVILVIIVLIMSTIFHQSSISWESGTQRAAGNMMGRALIGMISREMRGAIPHPESIFEVGRITIITLSGNPVGNVRAMRKIEYWGGTHVSRRVSKLQKEGSSSNWLAETTLTVATNLTSEGVTAFPVGDGSFPDYVKVWFSVRRKSNVSGVFAASAGPDGVLLTKDELDDGDDDIRSY